MATAAQGLERLLQATSREQLRAAVLRGPQAPSLPDAQRIAAHAASLGLAPRPLRLAIVHTYTSELLDPWLRVAGALSGFEPQTYHAPYGLALAEAQPGSSLLAHAPQLTLLMLQRTDLHPDFARPVSELDGGARLQLADAALAQLQQLVSMFRAQAVGHLVLTLLPEPRPAALGLFDVQAEESETRFWRELEARACAWLREAVPASSYVDLDDVAAHVGRARFLDRRYWLSSRWPFTPAAAFELARRLFDIATVLTEPRAKVIVLDADNTLWGGVIGEDGLNGIALGPDYPGNAYVAFQRRILDFQRRGFILAMCSKNNAADVQQVLDEHPHMVLRDTHFAARRVNWLPKPDNLVALAEELNLGLESFVFVDDSDHECAAVRHRLPQVQVVQVPARAIDVPTCLDDVARLEVLSLTAEDRAKTAMYAAERERREVLQAAEGGGSGYLAGLQMRMTVSLDDAGHLARLAQLTQKTNQFNLTTRRYDESAMAGFIGAGDVLVADFSLADVFGESGIVGLAVIRLPAHGVARLDTFLMSCRVIGRMAESAFLETLLRQLAARGVTRVEAEYRPTAKNALVQDFLPRHGFEQQPEGHWLRSLQVAAPRPEAEFPITVELRSLQPA